MLNKMISRRLLLSAWPLSLVFPTMGALKTDIVDMDGGTFPPLRRYTESQTRVMFKLLRRNGFEPYESYDKQVAFSVMSKAGGLTSKRAMYWYKLRGDSSLADCVALEIPFGIKNHELNAV